MMSNKRHVDKATVKVYDRGSYYFNDIDMS